MDSYEDIVKSIIVLVVSIWVLIYLFWDSISNFFLAIGKILFIILIIAVVIVLAYLIYYIATNSKRKKEKEEKIELGKKRRKELPSAKGYDNYELGKMSSENFKKLKKEKKNLETETKIALKKVKKSRSEELEDLNKEEKIFLLDKWKNEIRELIEAGNEYENVIDFMCGKKVNIKKPTSKKKLFGDTFKKIKSAIQDYSTDRLIKNEKQFETVIYEYLRHKYPEHHFRFQKKISKGRIDIDVDEEIGIELKIADNKGNLNSLFGQIEWYMDKYDKLLIVILDLNKVSDLDDFIERFEQKGAEVTILTKEDVRFKRSNHKRRR